jgi:hypothetical protein
MENKFLFPKLKENSSEYKIVRNRPSNIGRDFAAKDERQFTAGHPHPAY